MSDSFDRQIHPTAEISSSSVIGSGVEIGPFSVIGPQVTLGKNVTVKSHAVVTGHTEIGDGSIIFPFACVGEIPQDKKFSGEETKLIIGARNRIREGVTMNPGTKGGGGVTRVGDDNLFMTGSHVGHDVQLGNNVVVANHAAIAGHCIVGDDVIIGGLCGIHQFVRLGRGSIIGALAMVTHDVIPYGLVQGPRGELDGLNIIGLKRLGLTRSDISEMSSVFKTLKAGPGTFLSRAKEISDESKNPYVTEITDFILGNTVRSFLTPSGSL